MEKQRIPTYLTSNEKSFVYRDLIDVSTNEHNDILLHLDGGEIWQFTPDSRGIPIPGKDRVRSVSAAGFTYYNAQLRKPFIFLDNPIEHIFGSVRIILPKDSLTKTLENAIRRSVPPNENPWWKNLLNRYEQQSGTTKREKWEQVAHIVRLCADGQRGKPEKDRRCDYLTPRMLANLVKRLSTVKDTAAFEREYGEILRRSVERATSKAAGRAGK